MLSIADFSIVQLFTVAAIYVTHRTEGISSLASFKSSQRRDLWSVIIVYEFSALLAVAFDAVTRFGKYYVMLIFFSVCSADFLLVTYLTVAFMWTCLTLIEFV
jgi:hypothetical protein